MAIDSNNKIPKSSIKQEQTEFTCSVKHEEIKGSKNLNVPPLRVPEFEGEWQLFKLGEIGKTYNGLTGKSREDFGKGYPYITYKSIFDSSKIEISRVEYVNITEEELKKGSQNEVEYGDIFFTTSSETPREVGMASVLLDNINHCYINSFCFGYRLNRTDVHLPEFMRFYLRAQLIRRKLFILAQGSTRFNISKNEVMRMRIPLPKTIEQSKIAKILTLIDERIATQSRIIDKLQSLMSGIAESLTTNNTPNTKIADCLVCHSYTLQENQIGPSGEYRVYGASGICGFTDQPEVKTDSILIVKDGSGVGTVTYADGEYSVIGTSNYLTAKDGYLLRYLYYCLMCFNFTPYKTGMAIPHIYFKDYGKAKIYCPPIKEQTKIATALSKIESKIETELSILQQYTIQKRHLLQQMFI